MSKEESLIVKGVAILMMLYLHLFNQMTNVAICDNMIFIGNMPFTYILSRATNPVAFFIILSGYGLYVSHHRGTYKVWHKLKALYLHYWIALIIFVALGYWIVGGEKYPGGWMKIAENVTAWNVTYNGEVWFLFPYMMVMLTSKWIVRMLDRYRAWVCIGVLLFLHLCCGFLISRYGPQFLYHDQLLYKPVLYVSFLFPFALGVYMAKFQLVGKLRFGGTSPSLKHKKTCWLLILLLVAFRCCFATGAFHILYAFAFIILFVNAPRFNVVDRLLQEMGRRSTSMWFVHSCFCYYLFHDFVYGLKYPLVIFLFLVVVSYLTAVVIDKINSKLSALCFRNF